LIATRITVAPLPSLKDGPFDRCDELVLARAGEAVDHRAPDTTRDRNQSMTVAAPKSRKLNQRMVPRDAGERHRAATPLELLYDLCFVVAIAQVAAALHHSISHGHALAGLGSFGVVFFAIWWAWMGFAWFA
jgi:Bacterial low temperature requirement A protein (LtrA)